MAFPRPRARRLAASAAACLLLAVAAWPDVPAAGQVAVAAVPPVADVAANVAAILTAHNCAACHGSNGTSTSDEWPNLAGRNAVLIRNELKEFRDGRRASPLMGPVAKALTDAEIDSVAEYFSAQPPASGTGPRPAMDSNRLEEAVNLAGSCMGCHGPDGISRKPDWAPNLAGQKKGYLLKQFKDFRDGTRQGEFMPATVHFLKDTDFELLSEYFSNASYPVGFDARQQKTVGVFGRVDKIADGLYKYAFGNWNPIFLTTTQGVVLFDPISVPIARDLKARLTAMGLKVAYVVLTHAHGDHSAGASVFADEAVIVSSRKTRDTIAKRNAREELAASKAGRTVQLEALPSLTFTDRLVLTVGGTTIELETPAKPSHSDGDLVFVNIPRHKLFIAADSVSPYVIEFLDLRANPIVPLLNAVRAMEKRDFEVLTNGHDFMPKSSLTAFREYLEFLTAEVGRAVAEGKTVEEVKNRLQLPARFLPLALSIYPPGLSEDQKLKSLAARFRFNVAGAYEQLKATSEGREVVDIHATHSP